MAPRAARTGFLDRATGRCWYVEDLLAWGSGPPQARQATLAAVDRAGDPDEPVDAAEAGRILGYTDRRTASLPLRGLSAGYRELRQ